MSRNVPNVVLNNGVEMPILGFGVYQIPPAETERAVIDALSVGYRHLDTAAAYGNEEAVGRAIRRSGLPRDQVFVTTKLWVQDHPAEQNTLQACAESLRKLGLEYIDLYLIHQPFGDCYGEWRAMEQLHRQGSVRAIGVSNFFPDRVVDLANHNEVVPAVNQIETHPYYQRADEQELLAALGIQTESWGPFAEGRNNLFQDPVLTPIAAVHDKSVAQVVLRWLVQRGVVVIPKSVRRERMEENFDIFDFALSEDEMRKIATLDTGKSLFFSHRDPAWVTRLGGHRLS